MLSLRACEGSKSNAVSASCMVNDLGWRCYSVCCNARLCETLLCMSPERHDWKTYKLVRMYEYEGEPSSWTLLIVLCAFFPDDICSQIGLKLIPSFPMEVSLCLAFDDLDEEMYACDYRRDHECQRPSYQDAFIIRLHLFGWATWNDFLHLEATYGLPMHCWFGSIGFFDALTWPSFVVTENLHL